MDDRKQQTQLTARLDLAAQQRHLAYSETPAMIGAGILFILASFCLLFWIETGSTKPQTIEEEMARKVVSPSFKNYDSRNEDKIVYLSGPVVAAKPIADVGYLTPQPVVRLERIVEMYQYTGATNQIITKTPVRPQKIFRGKNKQKNKNSKWSRNSLSKTAATATSTTIVPVMAWRAVDRPIQATKGPKISQSSSKIEK